MTLHACLMLLLMSLMSTSLLFVLEYFADPTSLLFSNFCMIHDVMNLLFDCPQPNFLKILQVKAKKSVTKFVIDCTAPVDDKVLEVAAFEKYLHDRIKIGGKTGALAANNVTITRDRTKITVASPTDLKFSKRQLKYLSKRYLKKQQLRDYLRVIASSKGAYEMKYFDISGGDDADEE
mmetsp:Transcript_50649/g.122214  ORF Transcript_50649/g.122214 Transcript_50649/m.122214 type:complete len:178 (+) Transcript_50649:609-1142(+)